jgi:hypothetical protein
LTQEGVPVASNPPTNQDKRDAAEQNALLREVDEAVRQDEFTDLFKNYGTQIIVGAVIVLAAVFGWLWWTDQQEAKLDTASEELVLALEDFGEGQRDAAGRAFQTLGDRGEGGVQVVAKLATAGMAVEAGKPEEATKIYAAVAADTNAPQLYRDFATLREVLLRYDEMKPADVEARLKPLAVADSAWFGSAGELLGHAYLDQGKTKEAGELFRKIALDEEVPESIKFRARQMAGSLGVDAVEDVEKTLKELQNPAVAAQ